MQTQEVRRGSERHPRTSAPLSRQTQVGTISAAEDWDRPDKTLSQINKVSPAPCWNKSLGISGRHLSLSETRGASASEETTTISEVFCFVFYESFTSDDSVKGQTPPRGEWLTHSLHSPAAREPVHLRNVSNRCAFLGVLQPRVRTRCDLSGNVDLKEMDGLEKGKNTFLSSLRATLNGSFSLFFFL